MLVELFPRVHRRYTSLAISQWLGHSSFTTTHWYATVDYRRPRHEAAGAREGSPTTRAATGPARWRTDASVLDGLRSSEGRSVMWSPATLPCLR